MTTPEQGSSPRTAVRRRDVLTRAGLLGAAAVAGPTLLTACGNSKSGSGSGSGSSKTPLSFWQFYSPAPGGQGGATKAQSDWFAKTVKDWNANNNTKVSTVYVPATDYQSGTKLSTAFTSGKGPDIFMLSAANFIQYYNDGALLDLSPYVKAAARGDFDQGVLATRMIDGKVYGIPAESEPLLIYYSIDAFEKAKLSEGDIPATWDQMLNVASKVTTKSRFGLQWETTPGGYQNFAWYPFMWEGRSEVVTAGKASFDSPGTIAALQFWQDAIKSKVAPRTIKGGGGFDLIANLSSGYTAMQEMVSAGVSILKENAPNFRFGVFKLPTPSGGKYTTDTGGWAWVVNKKGRNPEAAAKFCAWALASTDAAGVARCAGWATVAKAGDFSPRRSVNAYAGTKGYLDDPLMKYINDHVLPGAKGEPRYPTAVTKAISDAVQSTMLNGAKPADAAASAQKSITSFLAGYHGAPISS